MKAMTKQILNDIKYKGKVPMMAETVDRVRFNADEIKPCIIDKGIIEKELALTISMKETYLDMKNQGIDVGYSVENQDYYIKNLTEYLNGGM